MDNLMIGVGNEEFFAGDEAIQYLGNVKNINLFIGANNTRKSRLLRAIAKMDYKQIVDFEGDFLALQKQTIEILGKLDEALSIYPQVSLLTYTGKGNLISEGKRFEYLRAYFDAHGSPDVHYSILKNYLQQFHNELSTYLTPEIQSTHIDRIRRIHSLVDLLQYVYGKAASGTDISQMTNSGRWEEDNANSIHFRIGDRNEHGNIKNLEFKIEVITALKNVLDQYLNLNTHILKPKCIYIPVLRSSRNLLDIDKTVFKENIFLTTINYQYFGSAKAPEHITVHTAQDHYTLIDKAKKGKTQKRRDFNEFESFIGRSFFQSKEIEIIAHEHEGEQDIIVNLPGEMHDVPIHNLGDGVQAVINLLFPIFTAAQHSWIFIDEPELNMHPGFQNLLIRTLAENEFLKQKSLRYFINSHSNHILSEVLLGNRDHSEVFVFHRRDETSSYVRSFEGFENATLDLLGVLNTSTLISNCSVWVEGITDRIYLRTFLTAYLKNRRDFFPIEGLNYSFVEYGGKNIVHYLFEESYEPGAGNDRINAWFINSKIFLLADSDFGKEAKHDYYKEMEHNKSFVYQHTRLPEIENILPSTVIFMYLVKKLGVPVSEANFILQKKYDKTKLGKFLEAGLKTVGIGRKIAAKSGTLASDYKSSLSEFVLQEVQLGSITWEVLRESTDIERITYSLFEFIAKANHREDSIVPF